MQTNGTTICEEPGVIGLERTNFFPRQLIGPDDLTQDQRYFAEKARRHNRLLHGWGVVCGVCVRRAGGCKIVVEPGYVLGPFGHEIVVDREVVVDLCREDLEGNAVGPCVPADPWCSDVRVQRESGRPLYVAIRYDECQSRPVRSHTSGCGCGCDESDCEYSRTRDSFSIRVLSELPETYRPMPVPALGNRCVGGKPRRCPPCPTEPWVILADVTLAGDEVAEIEWTHRRHVATFADFYYLCRDDENGGDIPPDRIEIEERVRSELRDLLDSSGMESLSTDAGDDVTAASQLPAVALKGISRRSSLAKALGDTTIGEVAETSEDEFVRGALADVPANERKTAKRQAVHVHARASRVVGLLESVDRGSAPLA